jgi:hypothetical protein
MVLLLEEYRCSWIMVDGNPEIQEGRVFDILPLHIVYVGLCLPSSLILTILAMKRATFFLALLPAISAFHFPVSRAQSSALKSHSIGEITRQNFLASSAAIASSLLVGVPAFADDIAGPPVGAAIYAYRSGGLAR